MQELASLTDTGSRRNQAGNPLLTVEFLFTFNYKWLHVHLQGWEKNSFIG